MPRPADPNTRIELLRAAEAVFTQHGLRGMHFAITTRPIWTV